MDELIRSFGPLTPSQRVDLERIYLKYEAERRESQLERRDYKETTPWPRYGCRCDA